MSETHNKPAMGEAQIARGSLRTFFNIARDWALDADQALARDLRANDSNGIVYDSVRDPGGQCVAIFRSAVLSPVTQGPHFCYVWNGQAIVQVYEKRSYEPGTDEFLTP